jgi:hypothetical protein
MREEGIIPESQEDLRQRNDSSDRHRIKWSRILYSVGKGQVRARLKSRRTGARGPSDGYKHRSSSSRMASLMGGLLLDNQFRELRFEHKTRATTRMQPVSQVKLGGPKNSKLVFSFPFVFLGLPMNRRRLVGIRRSGEIDEQ